MPSYFVATLALTYSLHGRAAERKVWEGCEWKPFESKELGIRLRLQDCKKDSMHYELSVKAHRIEQHRPSDDRTFGGPLVLETFSKPAEQPIEAAIAAKFITRLKGESKKSCKVRVFDKSPIHGEGKVVLHIVPTGAYEKKIMKGRFSPT